MSQQAELCISISGDAVVGDADISAAALLHLPVHQVQQPLPAQDLRALQEAFWVIRTVLFGPDPGHFPVAVGETEL